MPVLRLAETVAIEAVAHVEAHRTDRRGQAQPEAAGPVEAIEHQAVPGLGDVAAVDSQKRVAVLVDFGVEADAREGEQPPAPYAACAQVPSNATGMQVLDAVADVRSETSDFGPALCGIDGYPAAGDCFTSTSQASPADEGFVDFAVVGEDEPAEEGEDDEDSNLPLLLGAAALVVVLAGGGVFLARRNASA